MRKLIISFVFLLILGCTSNSKKGISTTEIEVPTRKNCVKEDTIPENFSEFIRRFHNDLDFEFSRVIDDLPGYNSDKDSTLYCESIQIGDSVIFCLGDSIVKIVHSDSIDKPYIWTKNEIESNLMFLNQCVRDSNYITNYELKSDSIATEKIFIEGSGTMFYLDFNRKSYLWYLTYLHMAVL